MYVRQEVSALNVCSPAFCFISKNLETTQKFLDQKKTQNINCLNTEI